MLKGCTVILKKYLSVDKQALPFLVGKTYKHRKDNRVLANSNDNLPLSSFNDRQI